MLNATRGIASSRIGAVVAGVAILATVGGTGVAVGHGMVNSTEIVDQSIKKRDIGNGAVGSKEVRNGTLGMRDMNDRARGETKAGVRGYEVWHYGAVFVLSPGETETQTARCPDGTWALGGGVTPNETGDPYVRVYSDGPTDLKAIESIESGDQGPQKGARAWTATVHNAHEGKRSAHAHLWVVCAQVKLYKNTDTFPSDEEVAPAG